MAGLPMNLVRRFKKAFLWLLSCVAAFTLLGFFALPALVRPVLEKEMSKALHRQVTIQGLAFNPYRLSARVRNLWVVDRPGPEPFASCGELYVNVGLASIFRGALVVKEIRLTRPFVRIVRFKDNSYNFSDLIEKKGPEKPLPRFSINNIQIANGSLDFVDDPEATRHEIRELGLSIPFLSNISYYTHRYVQPHFFAKINGTPYTIEGKTKPFLDTHETYFDIAFTNLGLPRYLPYVPLKLGFKMPSGEMDAHISLSFSEPVGKEPSVILAGTIGLKQIAIDDMHDEALLRLPRLDLSIAAAHPLKKVFHLSQISVTEPEVTLSRSKTGTLNVESIFPGATTGPHDVKEGGAEPILVQIDDLSLTGGKIGFQDFSLKAPFRTVLQPVEVKVSHFDTSHDAKSSVHASVRSEAGEEITLDGELVLDPLSTQGTVGLKSLVLGKYAPYYKDRILFDILDGRFDLSTHYQYAAGKDAPALNLSGLAASLRTLRLRKDKEKADFLSIPDVEVKDGEMDLEKREIKIGQIATDKGQVSVTRDKTGQMNVLDLMAPTAAQPAPRPAKATKASEHDWTVTLKQVMADRYSVTLQDLQPRQPATFTATNMKLRAENISTVKKSKGKASLSMLLNGKGAVSIAGPFGIDPMSAGLTVNLKDIDIAPFQPYFTDRVKLTVTGGNISASGKLSLALDRNSKVKAGFVGETSINRFASVDKLASDRFLEWDSLALTGMNVAYSPIQVDIKGISLTHFYARILVAPDGTLNLSHILGGSEDAHGATTPQANATAPQPNATTPQAKETTPQAKAAADTQTPASQTKIESVTLQAGEIDLTDKSIEPNYSASLTEIGGRVSGLSSDAGTTADVDLRGKLNGYAPLEITGKVNPLAKDLFVDIKAGFKDVDLSPASPYSGKYTGNTIEKGKLSIDVKYHIVNRKLDSENHVTLDQFTFGDRVNSPDATKLPVRLAVALLKDRNGVINLDLPVTGSLDDPKFSIGKIILKILVNLLEKAATSPFALLGAVFGHGEELSNLEFDYGSSTISPQGQQKLDTIAKALTDRPALKLEIQGFVDVEKDREALRQNDFMRKLKAEKFRELVKKGQAPASVDQVTIEPAEYAKYLKMAYKDEKFPKPRDFLGFAKDLPGPEMEKLMLTHIVVTDDDLRSLASQRAAQVREALMKQGHIEGERVFMVEPKSLTPEKPGGAKNSQVAFALR